MKEHEIKTFIIKASVVSSLIIWVLGSQVRDFVDCLVSIILKPFFSIDLDNDGEPDLEELKNMVIKIGSYKFQLGKLLYTLIEIVLKISIIISILYIIISYTDLIDIKYVNK